MKTFTHAGVSRRYEGPFKLRVANGIDRIKVLIKTGHSDIDLIELIRPMTKEEAAEYLLSIDFDNGRAEVREALLAEQTRHAPEPKKAPRKPRAKKADVVQPQVEETEDDDTSQVITADFDLTVVEEAPF
jgi:hypothetical protein